MATEACNVCLHCRKPVRKALAELTEFHQVIINRYKREVDELHARMRSKNSEALQTECMNNSRQKSKVMKQTHCGRSEDRRERHVQGVDEHLRDKIRYLEEYQESLWEIITADRTCLFEQQLTNVAIKAVNRIFACDNKDLRIYKEIMEHEFEDFLEKTSKKENDFAQQCLYLENKYGHLKNSYRLCRQHLRHIISYGSLDNDEVQSFQIFPNSLPVYSSDSDDHTKSDQRKTNLPRHLRKYQTDNVKRLNEDYMTVLQKLNSLETENTRLKLELSAIHDTALRHHKRGHKVEVHDLSNAYDESKGRKDRSFGNKSRTQQAMTDLQGQLRSLQSNHALLESEHKLCRDSEETCNRDNIKLQSHLQEEQAKRVRLESVVSELKTKNHTMEKELENARNSEQQLYSYIAELKHRNDELLQLFESLGANQKRHPTESTEVKHDKGAGLEDKDREFYEKQISDMKTTIETLKNKLSRQKSSIERECEMKRKLAKAIHDLKNSRTELEDVKIRLGSLMGRKLTDNNPNIVDLSDKHRPTEIVERFTELYDNQRTDAFDRLDMGDDRQTIKILLSILRGTMEYCKEQTRDQMKALTAAVLMTPQNGTFHVSKTVMKQLKDSRKAAAENALDNVFQVYWSVLNTSSTLNAREAVQVPTYVRECFEICWWMCVQDPPVVLGPGLKLGDTFDTNLYKAYSASGASVEYEVWPVLLLHEGGPLLCKGVAQGAAWGTGKSKKRK